MTTTPTSITPTLEQLAYAPQLILIRTLLEKHIPLFPHGKCDIASHVVHAITGLKVECGFHIQKRTPDDPDPSYRYHHWNHDEKAGLYIDLTRDQFDCHPWYYHTINILPSETNLYLPFPIATTGIITIHPLISSDTQRIIDLYNQESQKRKNKARK